MKGLWNLRTTTIDPGLGVVIFDGIVAFIVTICTLSTFIPRKAKIWPEARILRIGMVLLSTFFIIHWIDNTCRHSKLQAVYCYILAGCFFNTIRALADAFVLWGLCIFAARLQGSLGERVGWAAPGGILSFLALYHVCLLFALSFAWLAFADLHVINSIAKARNTFEIASTAFYFYSCSFLAICVGEDPPRKYSEIVFIIRGGATFLAARSFCEVVIVGQLDRWPAHLDTILRARDITYGLFSVFTVFAFAFAMNVAPRPELDPILEEDREAREQVAALIATRYAAVTEDGKNTAPPMLNLLDPIEKGIKTEKKGSSGAGLRRNLFKLAEIERIKKHYGDWVPIYKWQGRWREEVPPETEDVTASTPCVGEAVQDAA